MQVAYVFQGTETEVPRHTQISYATEAISLRRSVDHTFFMWNQASPLLRS
jgi:hypothetical protein